MVTIIDRWHRHRLVPTATRSHVDGGDRSDRIPAVRVVAVNISSTCASVYYGRNAHTVVCKN